MHPAVHKLSDVLNQLPIQPHSGTDATYRNPNGVGLKLSNFLQYDPEYSGIGMQHGNKLEAVVWSEYANDRQRLSRVAQAIILNAGSLVDDKGYGWIGSDEEASEGRVLTLVHKVRERDQALVRKKKSQVLEKTGQLSCEVCSFDFGECYGEVGHGFAECHHIMPISTLRPGEKTKLKDLAIVCANCHRMIHRGNHWLSIDELRVIIGI